MTCYCCELQIVLQHYWEWMSYPWLEQVLCSCADTFSTSKQINLDYNKTFPGGNLSKTSASQSDLSKRTWITIGPSRKHKYRTLSTYSAALLQTLSKLAWQWLNDSSNSADLCYTARKKEAKRNEGNCHFILQSYILKPCSNFHLAWRHPLLLDLLNQLEAVRLCHTQY